MTTVQKWMVGCGIGCGLVVVAAVALVVTGVVYLGATFRGIGEAEESYQRITDRFGEVDSYAPRPDGAMEPARLEIFLEVRESLGSSRAELESLIADIPLDEIIEGEESFGKVVAVLKGIGRLISPIGEYIDLRNQTLLDRGMGIGEYIYIYCVAYYSWLGHSPADGPEFAGGSRNRAGDRIFSGSDSSFSPGQVRRRYRRYMLSMLRNQLESLPRADSEEWRERLSDEIERLDEDPGYVLWEEGLPEEISNSLEPYRHRIEATYHKTTNCFEFPWEDGEHWRISH